MDEKFNTILSIAILPQLIALISERKGLDEVTALNELYKSKVYDFLSREETKVWHYSPLTIYIMWENERETGEVVFPEE